MIYSCRNPINFSFWWRVLTEFAEFAVNTATNPARFEKLWRTAPDRGRGGADRELQNAALLGGEKSSI
jgi:hypothetical protein